VTRTRSLVVVLGVGEGALSRLLRRSFFLEMVAVVTVVAVEIVERSESESESRSWLRWCRREVLLLLCQVLAPSLVVLSRLLDLLP